MAASGDLPAALACFDRALMHEPRLGFAHLCRAFCLTGLEREDEAAEALARAVEGDSADSRVALELARVHVRAQETGLALAVLAPAMQRAPLLAARVARDRTLRALCDHPAYMQMLGHL